MEEIKLDTFLNLYNILYDISKTIPRRMNPLAKSKTSLNSDEPFSTINRTFMDLRQNKKNELDKFYGKIR